MEYLKKNYRIPAIVLISLCLGGLPIIGALIIKEHILSFGILVLLFLALILCVLAVIALVAMYREVGRCHERGMPKELEQVKKDLEQVKKEKK